MASLFDFITLEHGNEHNLGHVLQKSQKYSIPKIYTANCDLTKRWYVYFSFRNPKTNKMERMKNIYGKANSYKTKADRLTILTSYRSNLLKLLKEGYSPFEEINLNKNTNNRLSLENEDNTKIVERTDLNGPAQLKELDKGLPLQEAVDFVLKLKVNQVKFRTVQDYRHKSSSFLKWLSVNYPNVKTTEHLTKKMVMDFLNHVLVKTSARNRNNFRLVLGTILQTLEDNEIIRFNYIKNIKTLSSAPKRNKTFSKEVENKIFSHLKKEDTILLLYIKFVAYNFLRPIEVSRLRVKDIDLKNNTVVFQAKNSLLKTKIIPKILLDELPDISKLNPEHLLFTPEKLGDEWTTTETNRRNYFSKRFKEKVKDHFNLNEDYGLYSFRHTYITKLYRQLVKDSSPFEAKSKLMHITGHKSMTALEKYLRDIDAELADDYSNLLK